MNTNNSYKNNNNTNNNKNNCNNNSSNNNSNKIHKIIRMEIPKNNDKAINN